MIHLLPGNAGALKLLKPPGKALGSVAGHAAVVIKPFKILGKALLLLTSGKPDNFGELMNRRLQIRLSRPEIRTIQGKKPDPEIAVPGKLQARSLGILHKILRGKVQRQGLIPGGIEINHHGAENQKQDKKKNRK
jgi:hypothetical protein